MMEVKQLYLPLPFHFFSPPFHESIPVVGSYFLHVDFRLKMCKDDKYGSVQHQINNLLFSPHTHNVSLGTLLGRIIACFGIGTFNVTFTLSMILV